MVNFVKTSKLFFIEFSIFLVFSFVIANGEKGKETYPEIRATALTPEENKAIDDSFLKSVADETLSIVQKGPKAIEEHSYFMLLVRMPRRWNKFGAHPLLKKIFPKVTFYKVVSDMSWPPGSLIYAESDGKFYYLPQAFNQLLLDNGLQANSKNIIKLAKAFVILTQGEKEMTFLEGKWIREERIIGKKKNVTYTTILKVKIGDEIWYWYLPQDIYEKGQFGGVTLNDKDNKVVKIFQLLVIETGK